RCFEVDTRGGVAGVFDGAFRIFFDDSLRGSLVFFAGCRSRFEDRNGDGQKRQTTVAKNILRYLPVLPRIQRLFMTEDTAQQMRWAVEGNRYTDKMIHPSDGTAWKNFVKKFPLKAGDPRSVAVAISTDGFNPYGPKYPGKNMNVYLEPLVDDLVRGWEGRGIRTYDASKKEYFDINPSKEIFSELDEINAQCPIFARSFQDRRGVEVGHEVADDRQRGQAPAARPSSGPLVPPLDLPFRLLIASVAKPPPRATIRKTFQRRRRRESHLGDSGDRPGTLPERGFISGGLFIAMIASGVMSE
ncbi:hypothetical protein QYE76_000683, partial [Lolium multiflorum]